MSATGDRVPKQPADSTMSMIDGRKAERLPLVLPLAYVFTRAGDRVVGDTETTNLSGSGVQFLTPKTVETGTSCQLYLTLPEQTDALPFAGRVAWCRPAQGPFVEEFEVGVAFSLQECERQTFEVYCHFIATQLLMKYLQ